MPELPEVESVLQYLTVNKPSVCGRTVCSVSVIRKTVVDGDPEKLVRALTDAVCNEIIRHGKYLFFRFLQTRDNKCIWMALHLRMTGRLFLVDEQQAIEKHTRLALFLDNCLALRFDDPRAFGRVWLVSSPADVTDRLGEDALVAERETFIRKLVSCKRQLKPFLLDQSVVAGIGNIYTDEILFRARLHPSRYSCNLTAEEAVCLYDTMKNVLNQAVLLKGANIDGVFEAGSFPVAVYGRTGKPCLVCGTLIIRKRLWQRGSHFCPVCQSA